MYWNSIRYKNLKLHKILEPTHRMYWNLEMAQKELLAMRLNRHIGCIETSLCCTITCVVWILNRHIGCIETLRLIIASSSSCLEPTHRMYWNVLPVTKVSTSNYLNRHIGCIETRNQNHQNHRNRYLEPTHRMYWNIYSTNNQRNKNNLNRHIGCIETNMKLLLKE